MAAESGPDRVQGPMRKRRRNGSRAHRGSFRVTPSAARVGCRMLNVSNGKAWMSEAHSVSQEYDTYNSVPALELVGRAVFGHEYRHQKSSLWPQDLLRSVQALGIAEGSQVVDMGCGNGWASQLLAETLDCQSMGWDISPTNVASAQLSNTRPHRCSFQLRDMNDVSGYEGRFDLVLSIGSLYWSRSPRSTVAAWRRLLRPGGTILTYIVKSIRPGATSSILPGTAAEADEVDWVQLFSCHGLEVTSTDRTDRFISWLSAWNSAIDSYRKELRHEMGSESLEEFSNRFLGLARAAEAGELRRFEIAATSSEIGKAGSI
ncbi:class I SAM-dependent methyltransferase [Streptomyces sp. LZ34]